MLITTILVHFDFPLPHPLLPPCSIMSIAKVLDLKQIHGFGIQRLLHQRMGKGNDIWERLRVDRHCFAKQILADRSSRLREMG